GWPEPRRRPARARRGPPPRGRRRSGSPRRESSIASVFLRLAVPSGGRTRRPLLMAPQSRGAPIEPIVLIPPEKVLRVTGPIAGLAQVDLGNCDLGSRLSGRSQSAGLDL